jgi:hypothetical protein
VSVVAFSRSQWQALATSQAPVSIDGVSVPWPRAVDPYAPFALDAVLAVAHAIDALVAAQLYDFTGDELRAALRSVAFDGVTGAESFDANQDGIPRYTVLNVQTSMSTWQPVGSYAQSQLSVNAGALVFASGSAIAPTSPTPAPTTTPLPTTTTYAMMFPSVMSTCVVVCVCA